jgi:putative ABC transport system permease protein
VNRLAAYAEEALASLWRNRVRSILTMLGMIIGSASIIAVFGVSRAATSGITSTFASFGQLPVYVQVDDADPYPQRSAIHYRDTATVADGLGDRAIAVYPIWQRTYAVSAGNIRGFEDVISDGGYHNDTMAMAQGRKIDDADVASAARVCVLTMDLAKKYFAGRPALGDFVRIKGSRYQVVGVYADVKGFLSSVAGSGILIPYTTFHDDFSPGDVDFLTIFPAAGNAADAVGKAAVAILKHVHGERAQYTVQNGAGFVSAFDGVLNVVATGLSAIGGVALIVAGIGIMNIMLVSVTERTREIGIRKAIGANRSNIVLQFLMEAVILALVGGGIGMSVGLLITVGAASLLSKQLGVMVIPYLLIVSLALSFSIGVGVIFGTYPALRAAKLDPIEALRT